MRWRPPTLPLRLIALSALLAAAVAAACNDSIPAAQPPAVDPAPLEDAAERVQAAAARLEAASTPRSGAIIINADALRLLALLSQLQIELGVIDALINPPLDVRPSRWPLEPEDGAALGFASTRLFWIHHQLSTFAASPAESQSILQEEETSLCSQGYRASCKSSGAPPMPSGRRTRPASRQCPRPLH